MSFLFPIFYFIYSAYSFLFVLFPIFSLISFSFLFFLFHSFISVFLFPPGLSFFSLSFLVHFSLRCVLSFSHFLQYFIYRYSPYSFLLILFIFLFFLIFFIICFLFPLCSISVFIFSPSVSSFFFLVSSFVFFSYSISCFSFFPASSFPFLVFSFSPFSFCHLFFFILNFSISYEQNGNAACQTPEKDLVTGSSGGGGQPAVGPVISLADHSDRQESAPTMLVMTIKNINF